MTPESWIDEVLAAVDGTGWRACSARLSRDGSECYTQVMHADGRIHLVQLPLARFCDAVDRALEIRRQLKEQP